MKISILIRKDEVEKNIDLISDLPNLGFKNPEEDQLVKPIFGYALNSGKPVVADKNGYLITYASFDGLGKDIEIEFNKENLDTLLKLIAVFSL